MTLPLIESHPDQLGGLDPAAIANRVDECLARACTIRADACLSEPAVGECARHTTHHRHCALCAEACRSCEDACRRLRDHLVGTT
jgi:hypothetical protein